MDDKELKSIAMHYFGLTPTPKVSKNEDIEVLRPAQVSMEESKKIKIKWENYIGAETRVARITPLDIMHHLHMKNTPENYEKAVKILLDLAAIDDLPVVRVGNRYLLINPKHRG